MKSSKSQILSNATNHVINNNTTISASLTHPSLYTPSMVKSPYELFPEKWDRVGDAVESPITGKPLWIGNLSITHSTGRFHLALYERLHPDVEILSISMGEIGQITNIAFTNEAEWQAFNSWISSREKAFGGRENLYASGLPGLPVSLERSYNIPRYNADPLQVAVWAESISGEIYMTSEHFVFTNEEDAMVFKLKFQNTDL